MSTTGIKDYDYPLFYNDVTCISSLNVSGNTILGNVTTCISSLNVSGNTQLNNSTTINAPLYINTYQSTPISALKVNSSTVSIIRHIIRVLIMR